MLCSCSGGQKLFQGQVAASLHTADALSGTFRTSLESMPRSRSVGRVGTNFLHTLQNVSQIPLGGQGDAGGSKGEGPQSAPPAQSYF